MYITTSVRNSSRSWEVIDREPTNSLTLEDVEVSAHDIGGSVGEELLVELRDAEDEVINSVEITAS